jgi:arginase
MPSTGRSREPTHPATAASPPIALIGAPSDVAAGARGACMGPDAIRVAGLPAALAGLGYTVCDAGNLVGPAGGDTGAIHGYRHLGDATRWAEATHGAVKNALGHGECPVLMGGDHSLSIGSVAAVAAHCRSRGTPLTVLWMDAHADFNTAETSPSGNIHGMAAAMLCGHGPDALCGLGPGRPILTPDRIVHLGVRSVDAAEKSAVARAGLAVHDMRRIDESGMRPVMDSVLAEVTTRGAHLHLSLDLDVMDPGIAPGVGTVVPGGLTYREAQLGMEMIHDSGALGSLDIVEVNPARDTRNRTANLAVELVQSAFGEQILARRL